MKYENLICFTDDEFERLTGVSKITFKAMVDILKCNEMQKKKSGRPHSLSIENQLLLTLKYLSGRSTQLQLSADYHLAESNVNRTLSKIQNVLSEVSDLQLPQRQLSKVLVEIEGK